MMASVEVAGVCLVAGYFWGIRVAFCPDNHRCGTDACHACQSFAGRCSVRRLHDLAFAALMMAEQRRSALLSAVVGVAAWRLLVDQTQAAVPLFFAIAAYTIIFRRLDRR